MDQTEKVIMENLQEHLKADKPIWILAAPESWTKIPLNVVSMMVKHGILAFPTDDEIQNLINMHREMNPQPQGAGPGGNRNG